MPSYPTIRYDALRYWGSVLPVRSWFPSYTGWSSDSRWSFRSWRTRGYNKPWYTRSILRNRYNATGGRCRQDALFASETSFSTWNFMKEDPVCTSTFSLSLARFSLSACTVPLSLSLSSRLGFLSKDCSNESNFSDIFFGFRDIYCTIATRGKG